MEICFLPVLSNWGFGVTGLSTRAGFEEAPPLEVTTKTRTIKNRVGSGFKYRKGYLLSSWETRFFFRFRYNSKGVVNYIALFVFSFNLLSAL